MHIYADKIRREEQYSYVYDAHEFFMALQSIESFTEDKQAIPYSGFLSRGINNRVR